MQQKVTYKQQIIIFSLIIQNQSKVCNILKMFTQQKRYVYVKNNNFHRGPVKIIQKILSKFLNMPMQKNTRAMGMR
jgi:uncharacterized protein YcgL (UPF0745 family)